jgi:hypothetical protein
MVIDMPLNCTGAAIHSGAIAIVQFPGSAALTASIRVLKKMKQFRQAGPELVDAETTEGDR